MKLYTYYDPTYYPLFCNFLKTLQDDYDVIVMKSELIGTSSYRHAIHKPLLVEQAIKDNMGDVIIISDSDIQFFSKTQDLVEKCITDKEIVVQWCGRKDYNEINIGFMAIRCCSRMLNLWRQVRIDVQRYQMHDEVLVNQYLKRDQSILWSYFPDSIWAYDGSLPKEIILHHAIGAGGVGTAESVENKLKQMQMVRELVGCGPLTENRKYTEMPVPKIKTPSVFRLQGKKQ